MQSPFTGGHATLRHELSELTFRKEKTKSMSARYIISIGPNTAFHSLTRLSVFVSAMACLPLRCPRFLDLATTSIAYMKMEICPARLMARF